MFDDPDFSYANLVAARIVYVVRVLPELSPIGTAEATARVRQRCELLLEDPEWVVGLEPRLHHLEDEARGLPHRRATVVFDLLRDLLRHPGDPYDDLVHLLFGR